MNQTKYPIVGYIAGTNEPIYSLPAMPGALVASAFPGAHPDSCPDCGGTCLPPTLEDLLDDVCDIADDMEALTNQLGAQLEGMPAGVAVGEDALRASLNRESLVRQLAVASQGVMTLKALIGTANQFLS